MPFPQSPLDNFALLRERISTILFRQAEMWDQLGESESATNLLNKCDILTQDAFNILFIGETSRGKSTLINALLGADLLPSDPGFACTAAPICVQYGDEQRAIGTDISGNTTIYKFPEGKRKFDSAISVDENGVEDVEARKKLLCKADLFVPISILKKGVQIHDSPGLNEHHARSAATWDQVEYSDAVVLVLDLTKIELDTDKKVLEKLLQTSHRDPSVIFIVWNMLDEYMRKRGADFDKAKAHACKKIQSVGIPLDHIFFLSAQDALEGILNDDPDLIEISRISEFSKGLNEFLGYDRCSTKLLTPLNNAKYTISELQATSIAQENECKNEAKKSASAVQQTEKQLIQIEAIKTDLETALSRSQTRLIREASATVTSALEGYEDGIEYAINRIELSVEDAKDNPEYSARILTNAAEKWIRNRIEKWHRKNVTPLTEEFGIDTHDHAAKAYSELELISIEFTQILNADGSEEDLRNDLAITKTSGHTDLASSIIRRSLSSTDLSPDESNMGASMTTFGIGATWLAVTFSLPFLPIIPVALIIGAFFGIGKNSANKLKKKVISAIQEHLHDKLSNLEDDLIAQIKRSSDAIILELKNSFNKNNTALQLMADAIRKAHAEKQILFKKQKTLLTQIQNEVMEQSAEIDSLKHLIEPVHHQQKRLAKQVGQEIQGVIKEHDKSLLDFSQYGRPGMTELESALGLEGVEKMKHIEGYFSREKCWNDQVKHRVAAEWTVCRQAAKKSSRTPTRINSTEGVFRAVSAISIAKGHSELPDHQEFNNLYKGSEYREVLQILFTLLEIPEYAKSVLVDLDGKDGDRVILAYKRMLKIIDPNYGQHELRPETTGPKFDH